MNRNIILLMLLIPLFGFTQSDLNLKTHPDLEVGKNLISKTLNPSESHTTTSLINDLNHLKSEKHIDFSRSYTLTKNSRSASNGRVLKIDEVQKMDNMFLQFMPSRDYNRAFGKEINLNNPSEP